MLPVRTVGIFNVEEVEKEYCFSVSDLGLKSGEYMLTDVWSGEQYEFDERFVAKLAPHESRLLAVSMKCGIQLYDANIRINAAGVTDDTMLLEFDYAMKEVELFLSKKVKAMSFNGEKQAFVVKDNMICLEVPQKGILTIKMEGAGNEK